MAIPEGWRVLPLAEDVELVSGQHLLAEDWHEEPRGVPYLTGPADFPDGKVIVSKYTERPKVMCREGDIVITVKGSGCGRIARVFVDACISRQLMALRPQHWNSEYIFQVLSSASLMLGEQASGLIPGLSREQLLKLTLPVPPLPEQKKIAAILSSVDEVIAKTEAVIAQLQIVKNAMMEQLLTKGMPDRHTRFKQTEIGEIPEEWEVVEGSQMFELRGGYGPADVTFDPTGQFLFLKVDDFNNPLNARCLSTAALRFAHGPNPCIRTYPAGSLVFPKRGAAIFKNRVGILGCSATVDPNLMILLPKSNLHSYYFAQTLRRIGLASLSDNSGIPQLNNKHLYPLRFALPSFDEQRKIASVVDAFDARIATEEVVRSELILLKQTLSSSLLSGELRVIPEVAE